ncbi:MAG: hypothetical protein LQ351_007678 [Letrouitia transgressa]|nr:MAG: hypothetical protein LQ351_007678 [Letrouitia transgressa]
MEGLSAAASGLAVASMAIQLADNVKKLHDFWDSIKDAPETVRAITNDLQLLSRVLADIALEAQHSEPDVVLEGVLSACTAKVDALNAIVNDLEPGFSSSNIFLRKWTAFRSTLKKDKIKNFQTALERGNKAIMGKKAHTDN